MKQIDFADGKTRQNVMQTAVPMLVAQVLSLLYNIVDRIYIGRIPGEGTVALGGVGLCFPVIILILAFTNLYGVGGSPLCSMARGRGDRKEAEQIMNTSFFLLTVTALLLMVSGYLFRRPLLTAFGASETNLGYADTYLKIYLLGTLPSMLATGLNPFINAQGYAGVGMMTIFIGAVTNIILDPVFIFGMGMGVAGAAAATVISQCISAAFVVRFLRGRKTELKLKISGFRGFRKKTAADIAGLGFASFVMQFTNSLVSIVCNHMLSGFGGDLSISVYTVISSVRQILDTPVNAITDGSSPVLSFNFGAGKFEKVKEAVRIVTTWAVGYTMVVWVLILLFPAFFIRIFSADASLLQTAIPALHIYFFAFLFQALQYSGQNVFKSLNMKRQAIFFSLFRKVIMVVPLTLILPHINGLGAKGVFLAEPISNVIGGSACFITMMVTVYARLGKNPVGKARQGKKIPPDRG